MGGELLKNLHKLIFIENKEPLTARRINEIGVAIFRCFIGLPWAGLIGGMLMFIAPLMILFGLFGLFISKILMPGEVFFSSTPGIRYALIFLAPILGVELIGKIFNIKKNL